MPNDEMHDSWERLSESLVERSRLQLIMQDVPLRRTVTMVTSGEILEMCNGPGRYMQATVMAACSAHNWRARTPESILQSVELLEPLPEPPTAPAK